MITVKSALLQVNRSLAEFILTQQGACDKQLVRHKDQLESWDSRVESSNDFVSWFCLSTLLLKPVLY